MSPSSSTDFKRRVLRWGLWAVALALFVAALRSVSWVEARGALENLELSDILVLVAVNLLALLVFSGRWWILLRGLGESVGWIRVGLYRLAGFGVSYFTPGPQFGGEPVQVLLLERRHRVQRETAVASVGLDKLMELLVNFSFLGAGLLVLLRSDELGVIVGMDALLFVTVLVLLPGIYLLAIWNGRFPAAFLLKRFPRRFYDAVRASEREAHRALGDNAGCVALALGFSFMSWAIILGEYWLMASFLDVRLSFRELVMGLAAARLAYLFVLPAGLGVFEAGQALAWHLMGFSPALGISMSLLIRLRDTLLGGVGLAAGARLLGRV